MVILLQSGFQNTPNLVKNRKIQSGVKTFCHNIILSDFLNIAVFLLTIEIKVTAQLFRVFFFQTYLGK